ncbi:MAG: hypothetical protein M3P18_10185 [Actinomycetota bacterium]|nr:hypothetical protein [Actinomycetota bacterium]
MVITDVLTPRAPNLRRRVTLSVVLAALVLLAVPIYQAYYAGSSGSTQRASGAFGVRLQLTIERHEWSTGDQVRGVLAITAPDAATLDGLAVLSVYPAGAPQTEANRVMRAELSTPSRLEASGAAAVPFVLDTSALPSGTYSVNAELGAQVDKGDVHAVGQTVTVAEFAIK